MPGHIIINYIACKDEELLNSSSRQCMLVPSACRCALEKLEWLPSHAYHFMEDVCAWSCQIPETGLVSQARSHWESLTMHSIAVGTCKQQVKATCSMGHIDAAWPWQYTLRASGIAHLIKDSPEKQEAPTEMIPSGLGKGTAACISSLQQCRCRSSLVQSQYMPGPPDPHGEGLRLPCRHQKQGHESHGKLGIAARYQPCVIRLREADLPLHRLAGSFRAAGTCSVHDSTALPPQVVPSRLLSTPAVALLMDLL